MNWDTINTVLGYISGPIIGAIIGLFTNYIAVRMLFRPYYPKKIGKWRIPFTPGIIPKRKGALAKAVGRAVGENLFTSDDIKSMLCSDAVKDAVAERLCDAIYGMSATSIYENITVLSSEVDASALEDKASEFLTTKLSNAISDMDISALIIEKGKEAIMEKKSALGMLGMFLTDGVIDSLLSQVKEKIDVFVDEQAYDVALPVIRDQVAEFCEAPLNCQIDFDSIDYEKVLKIASSLYESAVSGAISCAMDKLDIASVVEKKINAMDVKELEALCLSVMKKELGAVVWLGGIIGFIIGIINIFI